MGTFLFNEIIFGPVKSRRLGTSFGINLLPLTSKLCTFNCLYCECGFTNKVTEDNPRLPLREEIMMELKSVLSKYTQSGKTFDTITFAGNGEPTLHPFFPEIIEDTLLLRNELFPGVKIAVLSNATFIGRKDVQSALSRVDYNILKLDSVNEETVKIINCPQGNFSLSSLIQDLHAFKNNLTIQTLFLKGEYNGFYFDNTSDDEIANWIDVLRDLKPKLVMIYTIARETPIKSVYKISDTKLNEIANKVEKIGIPVTVSA
jgi:wyosine [tRNA(Phe)-imidazoG37] synthetase (radical SAM superfamily)